MVAGGSCLARYFFSVWNPGDAEVAVPTTPPGVIR